MDKETIATQTPSLETPPEVARDGDELRLWYVEESEVEPEPFVKSRDLGEWECEKGHKKTHDPLENDRLKPNFCEVCESERDFVPKGATVEEQDIRAAIKGPQYWGHLPSEAAQDGFEKVWDDVEAYLREYWDGGDDDRADAIYSGLTAYTISTWLRENLEFVPHIMLMGKTTGGKTRLLNTMARLSYRAIVSASATPASMFRLIDAYNVTFFVSEYHGLEYEVRMQVDNVVRAGQKRGERITRAEPAQDGFEPDVFDPFSHIAIATQKTPADDIINRCIQVKSKSAGRDMPATHNDDDAREIRNRLLRIRLKMLHCDLWESAEAMAYKFLGERNIDGRTREKLLGLLTVAELWDRVEELEPFVEIVQEQDEESAANSEDAIFVECLRDIGFDRLTSGGQKGLSGARAWSHLEIPYDEITAKYEAKTGTEKNGNQWIGYAAKRLDIETERKRDGSVVSDPELADKLQSECDEMGLAFLRDEEAQEADSSSKNLVEENGDGDAPTDGEIKDAIEEKVVELSDAGSTASIQQVRKEVVDELDLSGERARNIGQLMKQMWEHDARLMRPDGPGTDEVVRV